LSGGFVWTFGPQVLSFTFCEMSVKCQNKSNADKKLKYFN